ncbi:MAG TPA: MBL fold metallo-hydrolase [Actinomycetes bacterium]|nr:MBL fold metallo-hydrolase [Actinomycetes bacterium]
MPSHPQPSADLPHAEPVLTGLWSVPVPIPASPLRYVLTYAFEVPGGLVLVDPGWNAPESLAALSSGLATIGAGLRDVRGVLVTHMHPDHYGLAGRVREISGAWIGLHPADAALIHDRYEEVDDLLERTMAWLRDTGVSASDLPDMRDASMALRGFVVVARPDVLLEDGDRPEVPGWQLVAVHTPGHTPGHLCFHEERQGLLLTGDHVLPRITPNVSIHPQSGRDPLGDYLASLQRLRKYDGSTALPGHEWRFDHLGERIDQIVAHHEQRLDATEALVRAGAETVLEVATRLGWSQPWERIEGFMRRAAIGETHAHLVALERCGRLARSGQRPLRWRLP